MTGSVSDLSQDVRVAVAMTGGVSLAVWMGGVAREINLLQQASNLRPRAAATTGTAAAPDPGADDIANPSLDRRSRDLYLRLLDVLDVTVTVDVLSGTSAGGINAAMLGLSSAAGVDLAGLRDLWLTAGSLDVLLRDPGEKNPSALMQGDKVLYMQLARGIEKFYRERDSAPRPPRSGRHDGIHHHDIAGAGRRAGSPTTTEHSLRTSITTGCSHSPRTR